MAHVMDSNIFSVNTRYFQIRNLKAQAELSYTTTVPLVGNLHISLYYGCPQNWKNFFDSMAIQIPMPAPYPNYDIRVQTNGV